MDKNTIIGFTLIAAVLIGFSWWNQPSEEEIKAQQEQIEREAAAQQKKDADAARIAARGQEELAQALRDTTALFHKALQGTPQPVVLKNDFLELTLNTKGATVERVYIKSYTFRIRINSKRFFSQNFDFLNCYVQKRFQKPSAGIGIFGHYLIKDKCIC